MQGSLQRSLASTFVDVCQSHACVQGPLSLAFGTYASVKFRLGPSQVMAQKIRLWSSLPYLPAIVDGAGARERPVARH